MDIEAIFPNGLDIDDALKLLWPAAFYILGMAIYGFFVFKFYRFIASRDMFELDLSKNEESRYPWVRDFFHLVLYGAKYIILFPVFAYFWFAALTLILTLLSKDRSFSDILLIAFATVSAIRLAAYYNEELSRDMAKILPFAVLAIFLIDASFFKIAESLEALKEANDHRESIFYYLLFLIAVEFALRLILAVVAFLVSVRKRISQEPLARIHRRTALGTVLEEAIGCSSESGIMVLEQKPARKQGAPNRCCHRTNPTVSASSLTTIAWWPMPACSCRPP